MHKYSSWLLHAALMAFRHRGILFLLKDMTFRVTECSVRSKSWPFKISIFSCIFSCVACFLLSVSCFLFTWIFSLYVFFLFMSFFIFLLHFQLNQKFVWKKPPVKLLKDYKNKWRVFLDLSKIVLNGIIKACGINLIYGISCQYVDKNHGLTPQNLSHYLQLV